MNVGFGMGIIDSILQAYQPSLHIIINGVLAMRMDVGWRIRQTRYHMGSYRKLGTYVFPSNGNPKARRRLQYSAELCHSGRQEEARNVVEKNIYLIVRCLS